MWSDWQRLLSKRRLSFRDEHLPGLEEHTGTTLLQPFWFSGRLGGITNGAEDDEETEEDEETTKGAEETIPGSPQV